MISQPGSRIPILKPPCELYTQWPLDEFQIGDRVYLAQPEPQGLAPVGAEGEIVGIETDSEMAAGGRPYRVKFDLRPYARKLGDILPVAPRKLNNAPLAAATLSLGPDDIARKL